jgi:UDP-glucose 4-epimerase
MDKKSKILVTGGAGFIGSNLCEYLYSSVGCQIWSLDNYSTGSESNHIDNVTYLNGETSDINEIIQFKPDYVFHFGEYSRVEQSFEDIEKVWKSNKGGIFEVLQFCLKHNTKLIYSGSSTKFGDNGKGKDQSPYAWTKASNSDLVKNFGNWFDLNYAIVYFYNAYGYREISEGKYATLIGLYKNNTINNIPLKVVLPGTQKRNFTHINDITSALKTIAEKGCGDNYGIGSEDSYTVRQIAEMFGGEIKEIPERQGNRMSADVVSKKTKELGWYPRESIEEHIKEFKDQLNR